MPFFSAEIVFANETFIFSLSFVCNFMSSLLDAHNKLVCSTWGNYHFKRFDGDVFHLPSTCDYIMCTMCGSSYEDFNIQMRRQVVNDQPTITNITMKLDSTVVELTKSSVRVDGREYVTVISGGQSYSKCFERL